MNFVKHRRVQAVEPSAVVAQTRHFTHWYIIFLGVLAMYGPTFWDLFHGIWSNDQQGHGPIVLAISIWLLWKKKPQLVATTIQPAVIPGWVIMVLGFCFYIIGRSQDILIFEVGSIILMSMALLFLFIGTAAVRIASFVLFFMLFMVPLPGQFVDAMTQPMKMAVSYATEHLLFAAGYPISRTGVILQIGQYQLLVADACAGLHTLFTLEALGLLYLNVIKHQSLARNMSLATLIVPISFTANVIRVMTLTLITYYFGDEAGQGFLHGFAGMVLFMAALLLIISADSMIRLLVARHGEKSQPTTMSISSSAS